MAAATPAFLCISVENDCTRYAASTPLASPYKLRALLLKCLPHVTMRGLQLSLGRRSPSRSTSLCWCRTKKLPMNGGLRVQSLCRCRRAHIGDCGRCGVAHSASERRGVAQQEREEQSHPSMIGQLGIRNEPVTAARSPKGRLSLAKWLSPIQRASRGILYVARRPAAHGSLTPALRAQ
jgi:hypothetical protein